MLVEQALGAGFALTWSLSIAVNGILPVLTGAQVSGGNRRL